MSEKTSDEELTNPFIHKNHSVPISNYTTNESMPTRKIIRWAKIGAAVFLLSLVILVVSALLAGRRVSDFVFSPQLPLSSQFDLRKTIFMDEELGTIVFIDHHTSASYFTISFPYHFISRSDDPASKKCKFSKFSSPTLKINNKNKKQSENEYKFQQSCFDFDKNIQVAVYEKEAFKGSDCYYVHLHSNAKSSLEACFDISSDNWYGGGELSEHRWPLNRANVPLQPFITREFDITQASTHFVSFLEPYFLSAQGVAVLVDDHDPFFVSINENQNKKICFRSTFDKPYHVMNSPHQNVDLKFMVCHDRSARAIHTQLLESGLVSHPKTAPIKDVLQKPVWSIRGQDISNEGSLLSYVNSIKLNRLNFSQLHIDGNYSKSDGNFYFNEKKFPHSAQLIMELDEKLPHKKLRVGIEVFPYVPNFVTNRNFSIETVSDHSSSRDSHQLLDIFSEDAVDWYISQLIDIQSEVHVQAFRFSGGDAFSYLRNGFRGPTKMDNFSSFNDITRRYSLIASQFKDSSFIGSGYKSQIHGLIADVGPLVSSWDHTKGLKSIIPTVLTVGLMGYPFMSVGPIGGISHDARNGRFTLPPKNLYIRWLQLSIFLPVIEFSVGPWEYGQDVVKYTKNLLEYRQKILWPRYLSAAVAEAVDVGTPVIRPLWWIAPDDPKAQFIDCEFLVNNHLLVAPVLFQDQLQRDIYLPQGGWWQDMLHGKLYQGGQWLPGFKVGEFEFATFIQTTPPKSKS